MNKILFNDQLKIKVIENGKISEYGCDFYQNYVDAETKLRDGEEWKRSGEGARFRGDVYEPADINKTTKAYYNSLSFGNNPNEVLYSVTVDNLSGVMRKDLTAEKDGEMHVIHSRELVFCGADLNEDKTAFVTCVKDNFVNSHLAVYNFNDDDYCTLTYGDCCDFDASYSHRSDSILFSTKGAGRNADGEFVRYSPASIMKYDRLTGDVEEILDGKDVSYCKPKDDAEGNLFYVKKADEIERKTSVLRILLDVILIPWRLLEAIYRFLEFFTLTYTGKKFIKDGSNPAKYRSKSDKEIFIEGNLINAENEYKNNLRHKDAFAGVAPRSWELFKRSPNGAERSIAKGVIDYCLTDDGDVIYTNGKHVLLLRKDGKLEKLADCSLCTKVDCI